VVDDDVSTDTILPAGARVLPFRSNIPKLAEFCFGQVDQDYPDRARGLAEQGGHAIVAGENYGQGSSREHAVIAPRYLGLRLVVAASYARIHWQNLANFGVLALELENSDHRSRIDQGDRLVVDDVRSALSSGTRLTVRNESKGEEYDAVHRLSPRQVEMVLAGGLIPWLREHTD
jgi:aconitate hydratase